MHEDKTGQRPLGSAVLGSFHLPSVSTWVSSLSGNPDERKRHPFHLWRAPLFNKCELDMPLYKIAIYDITRSYLHLPTRTTGRCRFHPLTLFTVWRKAVNRGTNIDSKFLISHVTLQVSEMCGRTRVYKCGAKMSRALWQLHKLKSELGFFKVLQQE